MKKVLYTFLLTSILSLVFLPIGCDDDSDEESIEGSSCPGDMNYMCKDNKIYSCGYDGWRLTHSCEGNCMCKIIKKGVELCVPIDDGICEEIRI